MLFTSPFFYATDSNGKPLSGGVVRFYEPETTTPKLAYADALYTTPIGSSVTLDAAGRAVIFLSGNYKVRLEDRDGVEVKTVDNINIAEEPIPVAGLANASFEEENGIPGWTTTEIGTGSIERVTDASYSGRACIRITSQGAGGAQMDSNYCVVSPGRDYRASFAINASSAEMHNTVQVRFYDDALTLVSTNSVFDETSENPTSWEVKTETITPPSSSRYASLRVIGAQSDGDAGSVYFDDFIFDEVNALFEINTPTGMITMYGGASDPVGWMICDGRAVNRGTYSGLFSVIGETFGEGDGATTFNLPDFSGRAPIGAGEGDALTDRSLGESLGEETHELTEDEGPEHNHFVAADAESSTTPSAGDQRPIALGRNAGNDRDYILTVGAGPSDSADTSLSSESGGNEPHNNMQPSLVVNFIIKL